ncbi:MAG: glycoside hydrolase [Clostridia bacterium]|nr:glycoside hydrolase [Clostridia bacterium]
MKLNAVILDDEYWWGGSTAMTCKLPITKKSFYELDMNAAYNQTMPLFLSSMGRYIWSAEPFTVSVHDGVIACKGPSEIIIKKCGNTLKDAYLYAMKKHFPFSGKIPPMKFFATAQYNTWMEMDYNQTQEGVLEYARNIVKNGYPAGIIMIDEGWHTRYGLWEFDFTKFPDPKAMVDELHALGFKVMLWVVPMVTADGKDFIISTEPDRKFLTGGGGENNYFLRTDDGSVALVHWWNGYSAMLNMCKAEDREFLKSKLDFLMQTYGIDGFKFDGGNISAYNEANIVNGTQTKYTPKELNRAWCDFGAEYEYHEYKDTFGGGGKPTIQRIRDRLHSWDSEYGLGSLIPAALCQGLIGHPFICPDMIGGGEWSLNYQRGFKIDGELIVRMAQCSALFPMMQFSWAPWRVLDSTMARLSLEAARLHEEFAEYISALVRESALSGEPIIRHMEYEFPYCSYAEIEDQFMLGSDVLVAPVIKKGEVVRTVHLPLGNWLYLGKIEYEGGRIVTVDAPIETLPYFIKRK